MNNSNKLKFDMKIMFKIICEFRSKNEQMKTC